MTTEVWFRNPNNYVREMVEARVGRVAWDFGLLVKYGIDPVKHAQLYFEPNQIEWQALMIGEQGSMELGPKNFPSNPLAVYPTWVYGESLELLEEVMAHPPGEDPTCYEDLSVPVHQRPVKDQPHKVIITKIPGTNTGPGRAIIKKLVELQEEYPDCKLHIHGLYSYKMSFGMGFPLVDVDPRTAAQKGKVVLPTGKEMVFEKTMGCPQWVTVVGMRPVDLKIPSNRCIYNIKSALWAGEHWMENFKFKSVASPAPVDHASPTAQLETTRSYLSVPMQPQAGDMQLCNTCSLQDKCKYFRDGAVCSVPGSEPASLANAFKSRDANTIIDGLGTLLAANTRRLERGIRDEEAFGELDPEVTKLSNQVFTQASKLAVLINPALRGGPKVGVNVNVNGGQAQVVANSSPSEVMGAIVRELEMRGVPREKITTEMVVALLEQMSRGDDPQRAIEGTVLSIKDQNNG